MPDRTMEIELKLLIEAIYLKYSYDFREYSAASMKRRVLLALRQMRCENVS
ncbi:MAG TPA: chemotaxis protein CheR, partial [Pseudomonas sp.]|nr:chemotaxis protein CheR [Pseudomonas sp.]